MVALRLAKLLDGGEPATMMATWARELRSVLGALERGEVTIDGNDDGWVGELAGMSTPVRHSSS